MAADTRDKRMSMVGFGLPTPRILPSPDGGFALADRPQLLFLYAGLALDTPVTFTVSADAAVRLLASANVAIRWAASASVEV